MDQMSKTRPSDLEFYGLIQCGLNMNWNTTDLGIINRQLMSTIVN